MPFDSKDFFTTDLTGHNSSILTVETGSLAAGFYSLTDEILKPTPTELNAHYVPECDCMNCNGMANAEFENAPAAEAANPVEAVQGTVGLLGGGGTISYYFGDTGFNGRVDESTIGGGIPAAHFTGDADWTTAEKNIVQQVFTDLSKIVNLTFTETTNSATADYSLIKDDDRSSLGTAIGATISGTYVSDLRINHSITRWTSGKEKGGQGYETLVHELGHSLGLGHTHDTGLGSDTLKGVGYAQRFQPGPDGLNDPINSIMAYRDGWAEQGTSQTSHGNRANYGAWDIKALQNRYGANTSTATGDDTYTLPKTNAAGTYFETIWDNGGTDTINNAGSTLDSVIDLRAATLDYEKTSGGPVSHNKDSSGDPIRGGFTIANGVKIENAIGGDGKDMITGNDEDNIFTGGKGDDELKGGEGDDTAKFSGALDDYDVRFEADDSVTIIDGTAGRDDTDKLTEMEFAEFTDGTVDLGPGQDLAFVIDNTGSMWDDIAAVRASATSIIDAIFDVDRGFLDSRIAVVGYNDPVTTTYLSFTDDPSIDARKSAAISAINSIGVGGGGDFPEAVFGGLLRALDGRAGAWRAEAVSRKIVLFGDAPPNDYSLAPQVFALAASLGVTAEASSTEEVSDLVSRTTIMGRGIDDTPVSVQIFTVAIGNIDVTETAFEEIADETGGASFEAANAAGVVDALLAVINTPVYNITADVLEITEGTGLNGTVNFTITRDVTDAAATVTLTQTGDADATDVAGVPATVDFAIGEGEKIISIEIVADSLQEDDETFGLEITNVTEAASFTNSAASLTILDDDDFNLITGTEAGERLWGTAMADQIMALGGDDTIVGRAGGDMIDGGAGFDTASYASSLTAVTLVNDGATAGSGGDAAGDILTSIERLIGSAYNDNLTGSDELDDVIFGFHGNDMINGGAGSDMLYGGQYHDTIMGGSGDDRLSGQHGNDILSGGSGDDILAGGIGSDTFVYDGRGKDTIRDFNLNNPNEKIDIRSPGVYGITDFDSLMLRTTENGVVDAVTIWFGTTDRLVINGIDRADMTADMFDFNLAIAI